MIPNICDTHVRAHTHTHPYEKQSKRAHARTRARTHTHTHTLSRCCVQAALRIQARQRGIRERNSKILEEKRKQAADEAAGVAAKADTEVAKTSGDAEGGWEEDVKRIRVNQDKIAVALEAMGEGAQDNDASALRGTLQALLEAQAAALTLLQSGVKEGEGALSEGVVGAGERSVQGSGEGTTADDAGQV